jgi:hypothetical protein
LSFELIDYIPRQSSHKHVMYFCTSEIWALREYLLNQSRPGPHGAGWMTWESPFGSWSRYTPQMALQIEQELVRPFSAWSRPGKICLRDVALSTFNGHSSGFKITLSMKIWYNVRCYFQSNRFR